MSNNNNHVNPGGPIEERIWNYIDGTSSGDERSAVEKLIQANAAWQSTYQELMQVNALLKSSELASPSLRFTKNVMEEISRLHIAPATKSYINKKIIWSIGFFFISLMVAFLVYGISQMSTSTGDESTLAKNISKVDFNKFDFSKFFNNSFVNAFMLINVVLGLFLLDNYLSNKRKEFRSR